jgi:hypothetical protein
MREGGRTMKKQKKEKQNPQGFRESKPIKKSGCGCSKKKKK